MLNFARYIMIDYEAKSCFITRSDSARRVFLDFFFSLVPANG